MPHLILIIYLISFGCGLVLISLAYHMHRTYRHKHLQTYAVHLVCLNFMALSILVLRYIQLNISPEKKNIVGGLYILFMAMSALDFCAIIGYTATFILITMQLGEKTVTPKLKWSGIAALGAAALVLAKGVFDILTGRSPDFLMISLRVLDYAPKALILVLAVGIYRQSRKLPGSGKRIALRGFAALYFFVHLAFFLLFAFKHLWPDLFDIAWGIYFLALNLVPLFFLGTFLHYYHGKKLFVLQRQPDLDATLESYGISRREKEIIQLVCAGKSNREIEELLFISQKTVKFHLYNVYKKLGIRNRVELANLVQDSRAENSPLTIP